MANVLWTLEEDQECYETSHQMWHPDLLHLCVAPNKQCVAWFRSHPQNARLGDQQCSTAAGFLCRGEDGHALASWCLSWDERCISTSVRARGPALAALLGSSRIAPLSQIQTGIKMLWLTGVYQHNHHCKRLSPVGALAQLLRT